MRGAAVVRIVAVLLLVVVAACTGRGPDPACVAVRDLRAAIASVRAAEAAEEAGDVGTVRLRIDDARRQIAAARAKLAAAGQGPTASYVRQLTEAANYLGYIVEEFAATGRVDDTLVQHASREMNRRTPGQAVPAC